SVADVFASMMSGRHQQGSMQSSAPAVRAQSVGRNDLCPCGSGKKYKKCCGRS
ncbi:MAG: SEC-C domain-containing protein, partial [Kiritimatiellae bacterium]|nr:SEC-C domain-containing protein [Kiritimatiellia bacterium]